MRTKSECRERKLSQTSGGRTSPTKSGSGLNLKTSQENLRKRPAEAKEEANAKQENQKTNEKQV
jgi:hypothetical protein